MYGDIVRIFLIILPWLHWLRIKYSACMVDFHPRLIQLMM